MSSVADFNEDSGFSDVIRIEKGKIKAHVEEVVRQSVEATLNGLLDAEADRLCNARRYEHSPDRVDTRAGDLRGARGGSKRRANKRRADGAPTSFRSVP